MPGALALTRWLRNTASISRRSAELYNATAVADDPGLSISRSEAFYSDCTISGFTTGSGTVTVTGTDENDATASYTFTFTGNGRKLNINQQFKTITRVQTSGLADESTVGTVVIRATSRNGQPDESWTTTGTVLMRMSRGREGDIIKATGETELNSTNMFIHPQDNGKIRRNDRVTFEGEVWEVKAIAERYGRRGEHYFTKAILFAQDTA